MNNLGINLGIRIIVYTDICVATTSSIMIVSCESTSSTEKYEIEQVRILLSDVWTYFFRFNIKYRELKNKFAKYFITKFHQNNLFSNKRIMRYLSLVSAHRELD